MKLILLLLIFTSVNLFAVQMKLPKLDTYQYIAGKRDPFISPESKYTDVEAQKQETKNAPKITFDDAFLSLKNSILDNSRVSGVSTSVNTLSSAWINGEVFKEGSKFYIESSLLGDTWGKFKDVASFGGASFNIPNKNGMLEFNIIAINRSEIVLGIEKTRTVIILPFDLSSRVHKAGKQLKVENDTYNLDGRDTRYAPPPEWGRDSLDVYLEKKHNTPSGTAPLIALPNIDGGKTVDTRNDKK